jgi:hypothetical protein
MDKFIPYQSEQLDQLYTSLAKAQAEMRDAELNSKNPHFKSEYADLTSIVKCSRPSLTRNGLSVIQQMMIDPLGQTIMQTRLCHISGQWIESRLPVKPDREGVQALGSYITYLRRYSYTSLIGVVDADDDGEASEGRIETKTAQPSKAIPIVSNEKITTEQAKILLTEIGQNKDLLDQILEGNKITKLIELPAKAFDGVLAFVKQTKSNRR